MTHQKDTMPDKIWVCENPDRGYNGEKVLPHYHAYPAAAYSLGKDQRYHHDRIVQAKDAEIAKLKQERDLLALNLEKYRNINYAGSQEMKNLAALTKPGHNYPAFISINEDTFGVSITVRSAVSETAETGGNIASINLSRKEFTGLLMQLAESEGK